MSDEKHSEQASADNQPANGANASSKSAPVARHNLILLPGLAAISLYLLLLSVVIVIGAIDGHYPRLFLILPVFLLASCGGLLMLFRWAWAMALAAVLLLSAYNLWLFAQMHLAPSLIQGLLNLVFFLYLIRTEVREKLR